MLSPEIKARLEQASAVLCADNAEGHLAARVAELVTLVGESLGVAVTSDGLTAQQHALTLLELPHYAGLNELLMQDTAVGNRLFSQQVQPDDFVEFLYEMARAFKRDFAEVLKQHPKPAKVYQINRPKGMPQSLSESLGESPLRSVGGTLPSDSALANSDHQRKLDAAVERQRALHSQINALTQRPEPKIWALLLEELPTAAEIFDREMMLALGTGSAEIEAHNAAMKVAADHLHKQLYFDRSFGTPAMMDLVRAALPLRTLFRGNAGDFPTLLSDLQEVVKAIYAEQIQPAGANA